MSSRLSHSTTMAVSPLPRLHKHFTYMIPVDPPSCPVEMTSLLSPFYRRTTKAKEAPVITYLPIVTPERRHKDIFRRQSWALHYTTLLSPELSKIGYTYLHLIVIEVTVIIIHAGGEARELHPILNTSSLLIVVSLSKLPQVP